MKYSQLPFKTTKTVSVEHQSKNARLLMQAGFIHQEMAGVYSFLTFGLRVLIKIENIIRREMNKIGSEILMSSLSPVDIWEKTKRLNSVDVLMKTIPANDIAKIKNDTEYVLSPTHEDLVTPLIQHYIKSYKDFPVSVYQIQTKFRNEPRAKSGLLRCREFRMKDLYSFHTSQEDLMLFYEKAKEAYWKIFDKIGFKREDTFVTLASGGDFTKDYSHEFQTICEAGEDIIFHVKSKNLTYNREVAPSMAPSMDQSDQEEKTLKEVEGAGMIGVEEVARHVGIAPEQTTKTLLFEDEKGNMIAAAVRGGYDINEEKLKKVAGVDKLKLATPDMVRKVTGADVGYAGLLSLDHSVKIYMDESMKGRKNFEMGANKTNYHSVNVNFGRDLPMPEKFYDIKIAKNGDLYPETKEKYEVYKAAEIGNIFPLNVKFSNAFGYTYADENGQEKPVFMGSYGIGPSRIMGVLVEKYSDDKGLVWPKSVAPFQAHLISIGESDKAQSVYEKMRKEGIEIFYDDRDVSVGQKFADADLFGIPVRLLISSKTGEKIEWKERTSNLEKLLSLEEVLSKLLS